MLFDGIWYTPESQLCHTPKEKRPETLRESGRYIWWSWGDLNPRPKLLHRRHYMLSPIFTFAGQLRMDTLLTN